jgi:hypothetical protein
MNNRLKKMIITAFILSAFPISVSTYIIVKNSNTENELSKEKQRAKFEEIELQKAEIARQKREAVNRIYDSELKDWFYNSSIDPYFIWSDYFNENNPNTFNENSKLYRPREVHIVIDEIIKRNEKLTSIIDHTLNYINDVMHSDDLEKGVKFSWDYIPNESFKENNFFVKFNEQSPRSYVFLSQRSAAGLLRAEENMSLSIPFPGVKWDEPIIKEWSNTFLHEISHLLGLNDVYKYSEFGKRFGFSPEKELRLFKFSIMLGYKEDLSPIGQFGEFDLYLLKKMYNLD